MPFPTVGLPGLTGSLSLQPRPSSLGFLHRLTENNAGEGAGPRREGGAAGTVTATLRWASLAPVMNPQTSHAHLCSLPRRLNDFCSFVCEASPHHFFWNNESSFRELIYLFKCAFMNF